MMSATPSAYDLTVDQAMFRNVATWPDREAFVCEQERLTYAELGQAVDALASSLLDLGVQRGDRIGLMIPNGQNFPIVFFAVSRMGGVLVPINPYFRRREILHILDEAEVSTLILVPKAWGNNLLDIVQELRPNLPQLQRIIIAGADTPEGMISLNELIRSGGALADSLADPDDLFGLIYTSGTTGTPKAVMHSHRSILASSIAAQEQRRLERENAKLIPTLVHLTGMVRRFGMRHLRWANKQRTSFTPLPFHVMAGYGAMVPALTEGNRVMTVKRFQPAQTLELIGKEQANVLVGTPSMYKLMLDVKDFEKHDLSSLLYCVISTAPVGPDLAMEVRRRFACPVMIAYGATETGGGVTTTQISDSDRVQTQTIGRLYGGAEIRIVDDHRRPLPAGQVGELAVKMAGVMKGYYKAPEASREVLDDEGWYYTGDLGILDEDGNYRIVGRKKDMIIRGGQNVFPTEIENLLVSHPAIAEAAVVGIPSELEGETVWAFIAPEAGATVSPVDVIEYCRENLVHYKVPSQVRFVAELPRTATEKVQKFKLRDMALAERS